MLERYLNTIICGDCLETMRKLPDNSVDLIFADPPYWMQTEGELLRTDGTKFNGVEEKWDKFSSYKEYDAFSEKWLTECRRILKPNGAIWVIGAFQNIYRLGYIMQNLGFWILNDVVWSKPNAVPNFGGTRFQNAHETLLWCAKSRKSKYTFNYKTMKSLNDGKQDKSVWDIGICIGHERLKDENGGKVHATQKPERLLYKIILSSTKPDDVVLDPFFGTGTTGAAAKRLGRNFIGIEREIKYIDAAAQRIEQTQKENDSFSDLCFEIKPPKISMKQLTDCGWLCSGESVFNKQGHLIGTITEKGYVDDGSEVLSIHKMSAKILKKPSSNGWLYFYVKRENKLQQIDELRYKRFESNTD